jgi:putative addiction module killer protein
LARGFTKRFLSPHPLSAIQNFHQIDIDNMYPAGYTITMIEIRKTENFAKWIDGLIDIRARARILVRIERLASGNPGDVKAVGEGVSELRIDYGPGYRVYYKKQGQKIIILLAGGDKRTQSKDIKTAQRLAQNL